MSRDSYKGVPVRRNVKITKDKDLVVDSATNEVLFITGSGTLSTNTLTVTNSAIKSTSYAVVSPRHNGPTAVNWACYDGYVTFSGTGGGNNIIGYTVFI